MAKGIVNIFSDELFNLYSGLNVPCEKGAQNGWPFYQTETGLKVFQGAAEQHISGKAQSAASPSSASPAPGLRNRLIGLQTLWPVWFGAMLVICCVLGLAWQVRRRAQADIHLHDQYTDLAKTWGEAAQQFGQRLLAEVGALNSSQAAFATGQDQIIGGLAKLSVVDTELARLLASQADARRELAASQVALAQETTNLVASLGQTLQQRLAEAEGQNRADTMKLQAQIAEETTNLVASLRQTLQQRLAEAEGQNRADTMKLQVQIAEETTNLVASLRQTLQQGLAKVATQSRADTMKLQTQIAAEATNLVSSLRQAFQQGFAEATGQSRADAAKLQTQIADVAANCQALLDRVSGLTSVPGLGLALPGITGGATSGQMTEKDRMTTPTSPGIESPDKVHTRLGTLKFLEGSPDKGTSEKLFDNLDFQRAVQAYLLALPPVSMMAIREGLTQWGPPNTTIPILETLIDGPSLFLTTNYNTPYTWMWIDLHKGPLVAEIPPNVAGMINDFWFRTVADVGFAGPDKGAGGKYLILPPGYGSEAPQGYLVVKATTFEGFLGWRNFLVYGERGRGIDNLRKSTRVYPLSAATPPPANRFVSISGQAFNTVAPADFKFWESLNQVVQGEPTESLDPLTLGYYASIGIEKGKPFTPDARMKKILAEAAAVGEATARAVSFRTRQKSAYYFPSSLSASWPPAPLPPWR